MTTVKKISFLLGGIAILFAFNSYADSCSATIQNKSEHPWTFLFTSKVMLSNNVPCYISSCIIQPHSTANITYSYDNSFLEGQVFMLSSNGKLKKFAYIKNSSTNGNCPYVEHTFETGHVTVNDPNNGSFVIWQNTWPS